MSVSTEESDGLEKPVVYRLYSSAQKLKSAERGSVEKQESRGAKYDSVFNEGPSGSTSVNKVIR